MKSFDNESTDASVASVDIDSIIKERLQGSGFLKKELVTDSDVPCATTAVGELRMIDTSEIKISGERFRRVLEVDGLATSIRNNGQLVPIMVRTDLTLVSGLRRLRACEALGVQVFAHVVDVFDAEAAQIEEDRCRQDLTPYEMFLVTEALRPRLEDQAWRRKVLGKKADKAFQKGRVNDILAQHVSISRGTLRKIQEIFTAWQVDPEQFGELKAALENDRRVDRHYRAFKAMQVEAYNGPRLRAVALDPSWQKMESSESIAAIQRLNLRQMVQEGAMLLVPTAVVGLPHALSVVSKSGARLEAAVAGHDKTEEVVLVGRFGKAEAEENESASLFQAAFGPNAPLAKALAQLATPTSRALINLADAIRHEP